MGEVNGLQVRGTLESIGDGRFDGQIAANIVWPRPVGDGEAHLEVGLEEFDRDTGEQTKLGELYRSDAWSGLVGKRVVARVKLNVRAGYGKNQGRTFVNYDLVSLVAEDVAAAAAPVRGAAAFGRGAASAATSAA